MEKYITKEEKYIKNKICVPSFSDYHHGMYTNEQTPAKPGAALQQPL